VKYETIEQYDDLVRFCGQLANADTIAFDTEFVSEDTYYPELCLIQVASQGRLAIIDPRAVRDVTPFWKLISQGDHETVVHAGREEFRFCQRYAQRRPVNLFDVQVAAAFAGMEYPVSYGNLVGRVLGRKVDKGETRTDWRRRPLSERQLNYALQDVAHLEEIRDYLKASLKTLDRGAWMQREMEERQEELERQENREQWRRVSGISGLSPRQLAIVRALWRWRDQEARRTNRPAKRLLRDDLIVELAKRQAATAQQIRALRGMQRRQLQAHLPDIAQCIADALELPQEELPRTGKRRHRPTLNLLGQFLAAALNAVCRDAEMAPSLVGGAQEVRNLVHYHLGYYEEDEDKPPLAVGWRAEIVGRVIEDLLDGKLLVGVGNPLDDQPLVFKKSTKESE
jgi:ribonuclease D